MADFPSGKARMEVLGVLMEGLEEFRENLRERANILNYADLFKDAVEETLEKCEEYFEEVREADDVEEFRIGLERWRDMGVEWYGSNMMASYDKLKEVLDEINEGFDSVAFSVVEAYDKTDDWEE